MRGSPPIGRRSLLLPAAFSCLSTVGACSPWLYFRRAETFFDREYAWRPPRTESLVWVTYTSPQGWRSCVSHMFREREQQQGGRNNLLVATGSFFSTQQRVLNHLPCPTTHRVFPKAFSKRPNLGLCTPPWCLGTPPLCCRGNKTPAGGSRGHVREPAPSFTNNPVLPARPFPGKTSSKLVQRGDLLTGKMSQSTSGPSPFQSAKIRGYSTPVCPLIPLLRHIMETRE